MSASGFEFALSSKGLCEAASFDKEQFVFVVGSVEYKVSRFLACFFSGKVRRLVASDVTCERLSVQVEAGNDLFDDVVSLMNGRSVIVNERNRGFLERVCIDLDNQEVFSDVFDERSKCEPLSVCNAVYRLCLKKEIGRAIDEEVDFLARHFHEVVSMLDSVCDDVVDLILGSNSLQLVDEESLFVFIISRCEKCHSSWSLLRHVHP